MKALAKILAALTLDDDDWRLQALCAQIDPELFFPEQGESSAVARSICNQCPVRQECLLSALENNERYGVWGGLTPKYRRPLKAAYRRIQRDADAMAS